MDLPPYEEFLKQMKINLWLTGIPYGDSKIHLRFYILLCPLMSILMAETAFFVSRISLENFLELTQLAPCICVGVLSILKIIAVCPKRRKIFELSNSVCELYDHILADRNKRQLVRYELVLVNMLMKYFFVLNAVLITVYNFSTVAVMIYDYITTNVIELRLPYAVLLPFSTDAWLPWAGVYMHSVMCGFICVLYYTTVDGLYFVLTSHVCANFRVISDKISNLNANNVDSLGEIVKSHQYILKLGEDLEDIFTAPNLFNMLVGSLEICALGFNLTTGSWEQVPGSLLFIISVLLQILMMSVFGENIIRESSKIGDAAFLCNWYNMDPKSKKMILTIMISCLVTLWQPDNPRKEIHKPRKELTLGSDDRVSHKPQRLTAYKFSAISYGSFTKIISTSWSYFTILRTVYTPRDGK